VIKKQAAKKLGAAPVQAKIKKVLKIPKKTVKKVQNVIHKITKLAQKTDRKPSADGKQKLEVLASDLIKYVSGGSSKVIAMISYIQGIKKKLEVNIKSGTKASVENSLSLVNDLLKKLFEGKKTLQDALKTIASFKDRIQGF